MRYSTIGYLISEGFKNVFKNKKSTFASLGIMCCTMFIFGVFFAIGQNINYIMENVEAAQGMQVFIENDATEQDIEELESKIKSIHGVSTTTFVSKQQALDQMKENLGENQDLLTAYEGENNIFPASYVVKLTDLTLNEEVKDKIMQLDNVKKITSSDKTIATLIKLANGVRIISGVILILLVAISIFIISNTIKLTVHARRKEISIMKYVGATNSFIRWPFMVEGIIIGVIAAGITILIVGGCYEIVITEIMKTGFTDTVQLSLLHFRDIVELISIVYISLGIGIGVIGSSISMKKYLQV